MAAPTANPYEELRRRQVEENKRKLDELRLLTLSAAVLPPTKPPRNPRPRNPKLDAPIRRSGRIADLPEQPVYPTPKARRSNLRAVPAYAISKAQELKGHPTFVIPMSRDSAPKNNRLHIPSHFRQYLPVRRREMMVLVDEANNKLDQMICGSTTEVRHFLTGRWRAFADEHQLADGDCLVFQLIEPTKFKVYIVRASSYNKNDH